jgi:hypothetical protein
LFMVCRTITCFLWASGLLEETPMEIAINLGYEETAPRGLLKPRPKSLQAPRRRDRARACRVLSAAVGSDDL